jgi:transcriptional regulator with XRE-family HTH domain
MVQFRIRELRERVGITQEELSTKSGVSRATIWALERGEDKVTTTKTLLNLANALGVQMDDLFLAPSVK